MGNSIWVCVHVSLLPEGCLFSSLYPIVLKTKKKEKKRNMGWREGTEAILARGQVTHRPTVIWPAAVSSARWSRAGYKDEISNRPRKPAVSWKLSFRISGSDRMATFGTESSEKQSWLR